MRGAKESLDNKSDVIKHSSANEKEGPGKHNINLGC